MSFPAVAGQDITPALLNHMYGLSDTNTTVVTAIALANLSTAYTIPAGDATTSTSYRLSASGFGVWGSTQQTLKWAVALAGTSIGTTPTIAATQFSASATFRWRASAILTPAVIGSSGEWWADLDGVVTQTANSIVVGTAADNTVPFCGSSASQFAQDTTVANTFAIQVAWGSATGAPTITCQRTLFERVG